MTLLSRQDQGSQPRKEVFSAFVWFNRKPASSGIAPTIVPIARDLYAAYRVMRDMIVRTTILLNVSACITRKGQSGSHLISSSTFGKRYNDG